MIIDVKTKEDQTNLPPQFVCANRCLCVFVFGEKLNFSKTFHKHILYILQYSGTWHKVQLIIIIIMLPLIFYPNPSSPPWEVVTNNISSTLRLHSLREGCNFLPSRMSVNFWI